LFAAKDDLGAAMCLLYFGLEVRGDFAGSLANSYFID